MARKTYRVELNISSATGEKLPKKEMDQLRKKLICAMKLITVADPSCKVVEYPRLGY